MLLAILAYIFCGIATALDIYRVNQDEEWEAWEFLLCVAIWPALWLYALILRGIR